MNTKRFKIDHTSIFDLSVILEVDFDKLTPTLATEINNFWTDAEDRLSDADGDPIRAVIKMAAGIFFAHVLDVMESLNTYGMQQAFDSQYEGWPREGECGIKLIDWEGRPDLDCALLDLEEIE